MVKQILVKPVVGEMEQFLSKNPLNLNNHQGFADSI